MSLFTKENLLKMFIFFLIIISSLIFREAKFANTGMTDYCYVPPFVGQVVKPNVLFVMDFSGSMQFPTYVPCEFRNYTQQNTALCGTSYITSSSSAKYDVNKTYSGYFDPNKCYSYSASYFMEANCDCSNKIGTASCISGNLLNWITTTRIDIARMVLTGGRSSSSQGNTFLISEGAQYTIKDRNLKCEFTINATQPDTRELTIRDYDGICPLGNISKARLQIRPSDPSSIKGIIHSFCDTSDLNGQINEKCQLIMEFMVFASDGRYGEIKVGKQATISDLIDKINKERPYWGTPTGEALWEAYDFYKQSNDHNYEDNNNYINIGNANMDPYYDGSGNNAYAVPCRKSFILLLSDGAWNGGVDPVVPARIMATQDLRSDLSGKQNVYTYAIYAFGDLDPITKLQGRQAMITTAIFGGFEDFDSNTWPFPFTNYPNNSRQVTYPLSQCNPNGTWDSKCGEWDTLYNSQKDGLPYNFYEADDAEKLKSALLSALYDILRRASSGGTVATLTSRKGFSSLILQPFFYPRYQSGEVEISWIGFLRAFWLDFKSNLREDTVEPKWLNLKTLVDKIFQFVVVEGEQPHAWYISNETSCSAEDKVNALNLKSVFEAGCTLANTQPQNRNIYVHTGNNSLEPIDSDNAKNYLKSLWNYVNTNQGLDIVVDDNFTQCLIDYLKGNDTISCLNNATISDYFARPLSFDVAPLCSSSGITGSKRWKLGDIIYSTPSVVSNERNNIYHLRYFDLSYRQYIASDLYKNRNTYVFVGANDGMLHAFRVGFLNATGNSEKPYRLINALTDTGIDRIGKEEWAFIPQNAIPYLIWYGHKDYCHIPTIDYRTFIVDASIGNDTSANNDKTSSSWRTLLIGVMGFGGKALGNYSSSIFVLDLTDWLNGNAISPTLRWEKTLPDQTLTLSFPAIIRLGNPDKNGEWYLVIGSGPKDPKGQTFPGTTKLFFFNLKDGTLVKELTVTSNYAIGDIWPVDFDNDYQDDAFYFGTYNANSGNFYRVSLRNADGTYKTIANLTNSDVTMAFEANAPIFAAPTFSKDKSYNFWVYFGTGRFLSEEDKVFNYFNYLVGFKDPCVLGTCSYTYNFNSDGMIDRTGATANIVVTRTEKICSCDWDGCGLKEVAIDGYYNGTVATVPARGWYHRLENTNDYKEMIYSQPFVFGGNLDALVYRVSSDICKIAGETVLIAVCYDTGIPCQKPSVLMHQAQKEQSLTISSKYVIGPGAPPFGPPFQVASVSSEKGRYEKLLQASYGVIVRLSQSIQEGSKGRFILWIEK